MGSLDSTIRRRFEGYESGGHRIGTDLITLRRRACVQQSLRQLGSCKSLQKDVHEAQSQAESAICTDIVGNRRKIFI